MFTAYRTPQKSLRERGDVKKQKRGQWPGEYRDRLARARSKTRYARGHSKQRRARAARRGECNFLDESS